MITRLKSGANNTVVRAQANSAPNVQGVNGIVLSGSSAPGSAVLLTSIGRAPMIQMESGLTLAVGQTVYVSPNVAGKGTNVQPANVSTIGSIADISNYVARGTVVVDVVVGAGGGGGGGAQGAQGAAGATGAQGFQGATGGGGQGAQGFTGVQGAQGAQGTQGGGVGFPGRNGHCGRSGRSPDLAAPYVDYLPGGDWFATEAAAMKAFATAGSFAFTAFDGAKLGVSPGAAVLGTGAADAGKEGGALKGIASAWNKVSQASVWQESPGPQSSPCRFNVRRGRRLEAWSDSSTQAAPTGCSST